MTSQLEQHKCHIYSTSSLITLCLLLQGRGSARGVAKGMVGIWSAMYPDLNKKETFSSVCDMLELHLKEHGLIDSEEPSPSIAGTPRGKGLGKG